MLALLEKDGPARVAGGHVGSVETVITASSNEESTWVQAVISAARKWARHVLTNSTITW